MTDPTDPTLRDTASLDELRQLPISIARLRLHNRYRRAYHLKLYGTLDPGHRDLTLQQYPHRRRDLKEFYDDILAGTRPMFREDFPALQPKIGPDPL